MEWKSIDLSYELSLTCEGNVNYYKSVQHPIPIRENKEHPAFICVSRYIFFLAKLKGARREATL